MINRLVVSVLVVFGLMIIDSNVNLAYSQDQSTMQSLTVRGGYFVPARGKFRDIYDDSYCITGQYERQMTNRLNIAMEAGYLLQGESKVGSKYSNLYVVPGIIYKLDSGGTFSWYCGFGLGLNFRNISVVFEGRSPSGEDLGEVKFSQNDFGPSVNGMFGCKINLTRSFFLHPRLMIDFIYDSDTDIGGFGNTGGVNLALGLGYCL